MMQGISTLSSVGLAQRLKVIDAVQARQCSTWFVAPSHSHNYDNITLLGGGRWYEYTSAVLVLM